MRIVLKHAAGVAALALTLGFVADAAAADYDYAPRAYRGYARPHYAAGYRHVHSYHRGYNPVFAPSDDPGYGGEANYAYAPAQTYSRSYAVPTTVYQPVTRSYTVPVRSYQTVEQTHYVPVTHYQAVTTAVQVPVTTYQTYQRTEAVPTTVYRQVRQTCGCSYGE